MADKMYHTVIETQRFEHYGERTVAEAYRLIGRMPHGWTLKSLVYVTEYGVGSWIAIAEGPKREYVDGKMTNG
jgi:hypothetical protein